MKRWLRRRLSWRNRYSGAPLENKDGLELPPVSVLAGTTLFLSTIVLDARTALDDAVLHDDAVGYGCAVLDDINATGQDGVAHRTIYVQPDDERVARMASRGILLRAARREPWS